MWSSQVLGQTLERRGRAHAGQRLRDLPGPGLRGGQAGVRAVSGAPTPSGRRSSRAPRAAPSRRSAWTRRSGSPMRRSRMGPTVGGDSTRKITGEVNVGEVVRDVFELAEVTGRAQAARVERPAGPGGPESQRRTRSSKIEDAIKTATIEVDVDENDVARRVAGDVAFEIPNGVNAGQAQGRLAEDLLHARQARREGRTRSRPRTRSRCRTCSRASGASWAAAPGRASSYSRAGASSASRSSDSELMQKR